ncbi:hypothetical protein Lal_00016776 [Lupinus albus]|uniref:Putative encoded peptide n=1 Tax=Lupinus albus TaxID=3870 RepID=A0A6A5MPI8_LUPAL|nr:putative encoded peptide [Lupinus albus]KAF1872475.1 hypothetical protein Lal_00016776 [Lupinus albus]
MTNFTRICFLFILMLLSHELLSTEGRNLRESIQTQNAPNSTMGVTNSTVATSPCQTNHSIRKLAGDVAAFRPTTPGNSPGVGHSINS